MLFFTMAVWRVAAVASRLRGLLEFVVVFFSFEPGVRGQLRTYVSM